jgi:ADP-ribose pyrophosphatase
MTIVFKGNFLNITSKNILLPNNHQTTIEFIDHSGAVLIIPFLSEKEVVMIRQFRPCIGEYLYELPAGTIEKGENILECAKREIIEEIENEASDWKELGFIYLCPGYSTEKIFIFKAENLKANKFLEKDEEEIIETKIMTRDDVKILFNQGLINDSKTISAFVYCGWL